LEFPGQAKVGGECKMFVDGEEGISKAESAVVMEQVSRVRARTLV